MGKRQGKVPFLPVKIELYHYHEQKLVKENDKKAT
jgi:hypothetical protein